VFRSIRGPPVVSGQYYSDSYHGAGSKSGQSVGVLSVGDEVPFVTGPDRGPHHLRLAFRDFNQVGSSDKDASQSGTRSLIVPISIW